jgi:hypothetical protein
MNQHFEMISVGNSPVKENRLTTLKSYLAAEEKSSERSQLYVDDLKDSIEMLERKK